MLSNYWRTKNLKFLNCNIKSFQSLAHIKVDGIYGSMTDLALVNYIKIVQEKLGTSQDGLAGNNTIQKCKEFQKVNGLVSDGICGVKTREKLFQINTWNFPHFKKEEFDCNCGCKANNIDLHLVQILEEIRSHFGGKPVIVTSGTRCQKYNDSLKGSIKGSKHVQGKAADIYIKGISVNKLLNYTKILKASGIINYTYTNNKNMKGVVHIDIK